jgi:SNF2 family DNA or RNA helicase
MNQRTFILHEKTKDIIQRCDVSHLRRSVPNKAEFVLVVAMTDLQKKLYREFLAAVQANSEEKYEHDYLAITSSALRIGFFVMWHVLQKVWNHPQLLHRQSESRG